MFMFICTEQDFQTFCDGSHQRFPLAVQDRNRGVPIWGGGAAYRCGGCGSIIFPLFAETVSNVKSCQYRLPQGSRAIDNYNALFEGFSKFLVTGREV